MNTVRLGRNEICSCGSGKKFKHCCRQQAFGDDIPQPRPISNDGAFLDRGPSSRWPEENLTTRVAVEYSIAESTGKAEVGFLYPIGTLIKMADGGVLPVEFLRPGMRFKLEDGGVATTTNVEEPVVWEPPSQERDRNGHLSRRVIGRVHYSGYFPRMDFSAGGEVIKTTPGHLFWSATRRDWFAISTFQPGELLRNLQGQSVPVEWIGREHKEFCDLYGIEVEEIHTYFVGAGGILTHNGLENGCRVPRAAIEEALENGVIKPSGRKAAGVLTAKELNPQHQLFPQARKQWFADRGLDIDKFTVRLDKATHDALHSGGGPGRGGGWWNDSVMKLLAGRELELGRRLTPSEIEAIGLRFLQQRNLGHLPINPYQR